MMVAIVTLILNRAQCISNNITATKTFIVDRKRQKGRLEQKEEEEEEWYEYRK